MASPGRPTSSDRPSGWQIVRRRRFRVPRVEYGFRRRERTSHFSGELSSSWDTCCVRARAIPPFIRRSFSPKHEATYKQGRPSWAVFALDMRIIYHKSKIISLVKEVNNMKNEILIYYLPDGAFCGAFVIQKG